MSEVTIKQLLEAGVHFGHQTQRWNPKMKKYIYGERNGIYIINLEITLTCLKKALEYLKQLASDGQDVLFVGTKKQAQEPIRLAAEYCEMPYVEQRWLGGMLTNFETIRKSVARLDQIDRMEQDGSFQFFAKKEVNVMKKEREKLVKNLRGIRHMRKVPKAVFVIDSKKEEIAIREAAKLGVTVVAVLDTNCDPDLVDYPLPGNDDAIRAVRLFCQLAGEAVKQGRDAYKKVVAEEEARRREEEAALLAKAEKEKAEKEAREAAAAEEKKEKETEGTSPESESSAGHESDEDESDEEKLAARFAQREGITEDKEEKIKSKRPGGGRKEGGRTKAK